MNPTTTDRFDLYAAIHKTLRLAMSENLIRMGSLDVADDGQRQAAITQLRALLDMCRSHVHKENKYVHPVIESRCAGLSQHIANDHIDHIRAIDALEAQTVAFQCAPDAASAFRLYRQVALFVAENFEHMDFEESVHNAALWAAYTDAELLAVHNSILAAVEPAEMGQVLQWMLPALNPDERAGLLAGMRAEAPPAAYEGALQMARQRLAANDWSKLMRTLEPLSRAA